MKNFLLVLFLFCVGVGCLLMPLNNYRYSIPMPTIIGEFNYSKDLDYISIYGIETIENDKIASLNINETSCFLDTKTCWENKANIIGLGSISIFPYHNEYEITYSDENKILFKSDVAINGTTGEIDLNSKTLVYTVKNAGLNHNETRKIKIETDSNKIKEIEQGIITNYFRK